MIPYLYFFQWLTYLSRRFKATFHQPELSMNDESIPLPVSIGTTNSDHDDNNNNNDEILEVMVKSEATLIREGYNRAKAAGAVLSLTNTTTSNGSSMRSTFQSISSSVTAMRTSHTSSKRSERQICLSNNSVMIAYKATRMVLDVKTGKIRAPPGEKTNDREVRVSLNPFAQGGLRNVYYMKQKGVCRQVAKESRYNTTYQERLQFHAESSKCQFQASNYAKIFNAKLKNKKIPKITVLSTEVIRLFDPTYPRNFRYLAVENELKGEYQKWNSNNGYVNPSKSQACQVAQAFR